MMLLLMEYACTNNPKAAIRASVVVPVVEPVVDMVAAPVSKGIPAQEEGKSPVNGSSKGVSM